MTSARRRADAHPVAAFVVGHSGVELGVVDRSAGGDDRDGVAGAEGGERGEGAGGHGLTGRRPSAVRSTS
ncbi:MAG: hypothetical protein IPN17_18570 [Deltaproteobacteria bacterium]|nr:hypothetical protein [Deltaproteobacteria bacterium]